MTTSHSDKGKMVPEPLPCPFCGTPDPEIVPDGIGWSKGYRIRCNNCRASGPSVNIEKAEAIAAWNTRPTAPSADVSAPGGREGDKEFLGQAVKALIHVDYEDKMAQKKGRELLISEDTKRMIKKVLDNPRTGSWPDYLAALQNEGKV